VSDFFGGSVSVSGDTAIVEATGNDDDGSDSGSAYIFQRNEGGADNWGEVVKLAASDAGGDDQFGYSVGVSGNTAIVGARGNDDDGSASGSAYVFQRDEGGTDNWGEVVKLTATDAASADRFGVSVSVSGDTAIVGAHLNDDDGTNSGSAYIFQRDEGAPDNWGEVVKLTASDGAVSDFFGGSVSVSGDTAIVEATGNDDDGSDSGSAYIFQRELTIGAR
ncbi:MAG: FG-GAP repeat protein, partial [Planctomycetota bacterium]